MNWKLLAIPVSIVPFILIAFTFNIKLEELFAVGLIPFVSAALAIVGKLIMQGLKFNYLVKKFLGRVEVPWKTVSVRIGSEFVTSTTPSFVGGELVRIMWLKKKGIPTGKATWVTIMEIVTEVLVAGIFALTSAVFAFFHGAYAIGIVIIAISLPVTAIWSSLFFLSYRRTFQVPSWIERTAKKASKERASKYIEKTNQWMKEVCEMSRQSLHNKQAKKAFVVSMIFSVFTWIFYGISFMVITNGAGYFIDFFDSLLAAMASNALGNIPVTIGGSGLTEFGIWAYLGHLNSLTFEPTKDSIQWNIVIAWRIATYHVSLVISWILLMKIVYPRTKKAEIS
ncbi:MAG TPA: lysylphosphatidylglycerol synthase transmembrane domain-containing protein [Nitrosopumilaceae archaeon]|nr:lysylphosphatidylglycerol synthase transmembrane domain-containing protein [Nitrosopumilaceae archaeon]